MSKRYTRIPSSKQEISNMNSYTIFALLQIHPNIYGRLEEWKNDISSPKIYIERTKFGTKNQFPIPSQPTELIGTHS